MLRILQLGVVAAFIGAPGSALAEEGAATYCMDASIPRSAVEAQNGKWIELTSAQWQFLRGVYAMNPETPAGLPFGDKAVLAQLDSSSIGLVFFIDGDKACTPMRAPPQLLALMQEVATGSINHDSAGL
jgi:hypothetical protein